MTTYDDRRDPGGRGSSPRLNLFDRVAERTSRFVGQGEFFAACVTVVVLWTVTYPLIGDFNRWQIVLSAATSAFTFLLVALLQNSENRSDRAVHMKLDALATALAEVLDRLDGKDDELRDRMQKLLDVAGLEQTVSGRDVLHGSSDDEILDDARAD